MKKNYGVIVAAILILITSVLVSACAKPTPSSPTQPTVPTTPAPKPTEPIELKFSLSMPAGTAPFNGWEWLGEELEKRTEGQVKFIFYYSKTLAKTEEQLDAVTSGTADIQGMNLQTYTANFPLLSVTELPHIYFPNTFQGLMDATAARNALYNEFPEIQAYFKEIRPLNIGSLTEYTWHGKKEVQKPSDLKGMKIATTGLPGELVKSCGASAIPVYLSDFYMSMKTGQIDGFLMGWSGMSMFKLWEVSSYHLDVSFGRWTQIIAMNTNSWNRLSPDVQKIITELTPEATRLGNEKMMVSWDKGRESTENYDGTKLIVVPTGEQIDTWQEAGSPVEQIWLEDMKKAGTSSGEKVLARFKQLAAESMKK